MAGRGDGLSVGAKLLLLAAALGTLAVIVALALVISDRLQLREVGLLPEELGNHLLPVTGPDGVTHEVRARDYDVESLRPPPLADDEFARVAFLGGSVLQPMALAAFDVLSERGLYFHDHMQGVPGSNSGVTVRFAEHYLAEWRPDYVVIYHGANDVILMSRFPEYHPITEPANQRRAWAVIRAHYERLLAYCREMGAELIIATFPAPDVTDASPEERTRMELLFARDFGHEEIGDPTVWGVLLDSYNAMLAEFAAEHGLRVADVAALAPSDSTLFLDEAHVTEEGARLHGRVVADTLEPLIRGFQRER